jgi:Tol biopolymer transport system component
MALSAGTRLGPYEILAPLGAGGMGEVYRARDTRLDRDVALKVLPAHLSASPELQRRLEREAKAVSQLSHPHICTLYDVGREGETDFLVMEYLEGETLAHRLEQGPLPLDQALRTAGEIADALDKAHRQGVVHRDLKPGNIMLTKSGAKLLDFGLAKLREASSGEGAGIESALPTQARPLTEEGKIVGTYPYMAPEQLEGKAADARTDIFAFGAVLYEMVTGKRAFEGKSRASLIAAIMSSEPRPITELQPMTPPLLDRVVRRCLAKDPDERWQSAGDLAAELGWIAEGLAQREEPAPSRAAPWKLVHAVWAGATVALLAGLVWSLSRAPEPGSIPRSPVRAVLPMAAGEEIAVARHLPFSVGRPSVALSPDGSKMALVVADDDSTRLHLRVLAEAESTPVAGTEGGFDPFFSPDGEWLGFFTEDRVKKVSLRGGEAVTLSEAPNPMGGVWSEDDTVVFSAWQGERLARVSAFGGEPEPLELPAGYFSVYWPAALPGGEAVLLTAFEPSVSANSDFWSLLAYFPDTGHAKVLLHGGAFARYVPTGHLLYARGGALHAAPFDVQRIEVTGASTPVLDGVRVELNGAAQVSCSRDGTLVYVPGGAMSVAEFTWVGRDGAAKPLGIPPRAFGTFQLSPEGRRLAVVVNDRRQEIWTYDLERGTRNTLAAEGTNESPIWAPDGARVAFLSVRDGRGVVFSMAPDGGDAPDELTEAQERLLYPSSWTPDGKALVLDSWSAGAGTALWILPWQDEREVRPFLDTPASEWGSDLSPNGRWIAYTSDVAGRFEVYVQPFPEGGRTWTISTSGGEEPIWSPKGDELFYRDGDRLLAVPVSIEPKVAAGKPQEAFRGSFLNVWGRSYDVGPDARRFLLLRSVAEEGHQPQLILNWFEELKEKMREAGQ